MLKSLLRHLFGGRELPGAFRRLLPDYDVYQEAQFEGRDLTRIVVTRYGLMMYNRNDYVIGRSLERYGEWCQQELDLLARFLRPGMTVLDVGAHIGTHTLFFSRAAGPGGRVHAFEPQRFVYYVLAGNVALNGLQNVDCRQIALGARSATVAMAASDYGDSGNFGALRLAPAAGAREPVAVSRIDDLGVDRVDLIKIDVEGMEQEVLEGASNAIRRCRPILYLENNREEGARALVEHVDALDYDMYWHTPRYFNEDNFAGEKENVFGAAGETNMLCLPRATGAQVQALPPVTLPFAGLRR